MTELQQQATIFGTIFILANKLQTLGDAFDKNVTIKQWLFLVSVSQFQEPPTLSEVAEVIGYSRQNAKRIATALEESGFLTIARDTNDARALRIRLTPKFSTYFAQREKRELEFIRKLFDGFDAELTEGFYQGLVRLGENILNMEKENEKFKKEIEE
ncbi:MAG TPA: MarR family transcriptional regulator [Peptococcaceae bacterium]|nr:MarR family transcriptional regulator [Peptococcaceae bacterium]